MLGEYVQKAFLEVNQNLPPLEYWAYCDTDDQKTRFWEMKNFHSILCHSFQDYFAGQAEEIYYQLPEKTRDFYAAFRDFYLSFYALIRHNWKEIEATAKKKNIDLIGFASSPGEALIRVVENDCAACFSQCLKPYHRWTPYRLRKLAQEELAIQKKLTLLKGKEPDVSLKKKIKCYQSTLNQLFRDYGGYFAFREFCVEICSQATGREAKRTYKEYERKCQALDSEVQYQIHPKRRRKGEEWRRGIKRPAM